MPVKWGILSTAKINRLFLEGARAAENVEVVAVASRDSSHAEEFAREHGIPRSHGSYESILADPEVEALYIPLPNSMHVPWTIRALEAGKHVLCEKPLSRHVAEVERAFDVAGQQGRLLMEAFMYRHNPQTERVRELVDHGAVGPVRVIRSSFSFFAPDPSNVRLAPELDGGALMDVGCYCVSGTRWLAGEPERVTATQVIGGGGVDVVFAGTMSFADGIVAHFDCGLTTARRDELEVVGEHGSLFLDDPWHARRPVIEARRDEGTERIELPPLNSYGLEAENFSAAVRGEAEPRLGREDAVGQARAIEMLYSAAGGYGASRASPQPPDSAGV